LGIGKVKLQGFLLMCDSINLANGLSANQTICHDCAFHTQVAAIIQCIHPEKLGVNCATVIFCNSFQAGQEIDSPCVSFEEDDRE
jgi:hypothetical protein